MSSTIPHIKICGITTQSTLDQCAALGTEFIGLVFVKASPRYIEPVDAGKLTIPAQSNMQKVGLFVDPSLADIARVFEYCELDLIQLHGNELPEDVAIIKNAFDKPVIKAFGIENKTDLSNIAAYHDVCDWILLDKKSKQHGGTGQIFDWSIIQDFAPTKPWMLAGGLDANNVAEAINLLSPRAVDVSSGVETEKGIKDSVKIKEFIEAVKQAS